MWQSISQQRMPDPKHTDPKHKHLQRFYRIRATAKKDQTIVSRGAGKSLPRSCSRNRLLSVTADPAHDPPGSRSSAEEGETSVNIGPIMRSPGPPAARARRTGIKAGLNFLSFRSDYGMPSTTVACTLR